MKNKILIALLSVLLSFTAKSEIIDGICGDNLTWRLNTETGVLKIYGTGEMYNYHASVTPWKQYHNKVLTIFIENGVTSIGAYAFYLCNNLVFIEIPNSITSIKSFSFQKCVHLESVEIPNSVTYIGGSAFRDCSGLVSVEIPNSVTSIEPYTFAFCQSLESVEIPNSVTSIGMYAFNRCSSLKSVEIPNSVTSIGNDAFNHCSSLESIEIPNSVTSIGMYAFYCCSSLVSVEIPNSVTSIKQGTFVYCSGLKSVEIPNSVDSIGGTAFYDCSSLESVEIPNSVTYIGRQSLGNCSSLETVICLATTPPKTEHDMYGAVFSSSTYESATLYVPFGCSQTYGNAYDWKQFTHIEELPEHTDIDENSIVEMSAFPNPASDFVNINCEKIKNVQVFSIDGKMIQYFSVQSDEIQIDMSNLPNGTYLFIIGTETGTTTRKIIKK